MTVESAASVWSNLIAAAPCLRLVGALDRFGRKLPIAQIFFWCGGKAAAAQRGRLIIQTLTRA